MIPDHIVEASARRQKIFRIDIVGGCQLLCVGCPNSSIRLKVRDMPVEMLADIMANIDTTAERLCLFNYGEPLLHHDLPGIFGVLAQYVEKFDFLEISTNAQFVRWDQFEEVVKTRLLDRLVVSCDGDATAEQYEWMRPPAKWDKLVDFLTTASKLRERLHPKMQLMTRTVVLKEEDQKKWINLLEPLGWETEFLPWRRLPDASENLSDHKLTPGVGVCSFLDGKHTYVSWDGTVVPCCGHPQAGEFGDLKSQKWSEVRFGQRRKKFIETLARGRESLPICAQCEFGCAGPSIPSPEWLINPHIPPVLNRQPAPELSRRVQEGLVQILDSQRQGIDPVR